MLSLSACLTEKGEESVLTLLAGVGVGGQLDVVRREKADGTVQLPFPPIGILSAQHVDDLTLAERQLVVVLSRVVVHANHLAHCGMKTRTESKCVCKRVL